MTSTAVPPPTAPPAAAPANGTAAVPTVPTTSVTLHDGTRLPYRETGNPGGVPVVLLHGLSDSWLSYRTILDLLPPTVHAFAVTQRGHHGADAPAGGYDIDQLAADALGFLSGSCGPPRAPMGCS